MVLEIGEVCAQLVVAIYLVMVITFEFLVLLLRIPGLDLFGLRLGAFVQRKANFDVVSTTSSRFPLSICIPVDRYR